MPVNIIHTITPILQPQNSNLCWAAAIAMVLGGNETTESVRQRAVAAGRSVNPDGSLSSRDQPTISLLAGTFRLRCQDVRTVDLTVALLTRWMTPGRIAILGSFSYTGQMTSALHAICAYSLVGPGSDENTLLGYVDPYQHGLPPPRALNWLLDNFLTYPHYVFYQGNP